MGSGTVFVTFVCENNPVSEEHAASSVQRTDVKVIKYLSGP